LLDFRGLSQPFRRDSIGAREECGKSKNSRDQDKSGKGLHCAAFAAQWMQAFDARCNRPLVPVLAGEQRR